MASLLLSFLPHQARSTSKFYLYFVMEPLWRKRFSSGSLDPQDRFLESHSLYRKHTLHDGSSLFRIVAEQLYDTQSLHYDVRQECVRYMIFKRRRFEKYIEEDYDTYLKRMTKPRTMGTLVELRAMCFLYRRNVHFYEPGRLAQIVTFDSKFTDYFSVFYSPNKNFASVLTRENYETAAVAQSICYKLIYRDLLRTPDVELAVQKILYPGSFKWSFKAQQKNLLRHTKCILVNPKYCSYHNRGFGVSCVLQLLNNGQLPFSYKVAKSMDPLVYRNVDIDAWRDALLEAKHLRVYMGDYYFRPGAKCRVELPEGEFISYIQKIIRREHACVIFVEKLGKKLQVALSQVHPLPPDEFRPWTLSHIQERRRKRYISDYKGTLRGERLLQPRSTSIQWTDNSQWFSEISCGYGAAVDNTSQSVEKKPQPNWTRPQPQLQMWPQQPQHACFKQQERHKTHLQPWDHTQIAKQQMYFPQTNLLRQVPEQKMPQLQSQQQSQWMTMPDIVPHSSSRFLSPYYKLHLTPHTIPHF